MMIFQFCSKCKGITIYFNNLEYDSKGTLYFNRICVKSIYLLKDKDVKGSNFGVCLNERFEILPDLGSEYMTAENNCITLALLMFHLYPAKLI
jgi:hypothetical protein